MATVSAGAQATNPIAAERWVLSLIALTLVGRVVLAATLGLGIDEGYTVATARTFALGTYDHPPLAWWLAGGSSRISGSEAALAVRLPFILLFALTTWLMFALTRLLFGSRAGLFAALNLNLAPVLAWTTGTFVLPDGSLLTALLAGAYCVARVLFVPGTPAALWWLGARVPSAALPACPSCTAASPGSPGLRWTPPLPVSKTEPLAISERGAKPSRLSARGRTRPLRQSPRVGTACDSATSNPP